MKREHLSLLETTLTQLEELCLIEGEGEGEEPANWEEEIAGWKVLLKQFTEAYDQVTKKVKRRSLAFFQLIYVGILSGHFFTLSDQTMLLDVHWLVLRTASPSLFFNLAVPTK